MSGPVQLVDHPLVQHKLSLMRDKNCPTIQFRQLLGEIAVFLAYEAMKELPLKRQSIQTPLEAYDAPLLTGKKLCLISILRAGEGLLGPLIDLVPSARVGHVGLARDEQTLQPVEYLFKVPSDLQQRRVFVLDPMLATGNSAVAAIDRLSKAGAKDMYFICLLAAPEGIETLHRAYPSLPIITAAIDRQLNDKGYILPGLGDAGDRLFGTR